MSTTASVVVLRAPAGPGAAPPAATVAVSRGPLAAEVHEELDALVRRVGELAAEGNPADVAVLEAALRRPLSAAHQLRRADPHIGLILLVEPTAVERTEQKLAFTPEIGDAVVVAADRPHQELVATAARVGDAARRNRQVRAAFDAMNVELSSRSPGTGVAPYRHAVSERYLAALLRHAPDAIVSIDVSARVVTVNAAAARLLGLDPAEAEGAALTEAVSGPGTAGLEEMVAAALGGERALSRDLSLHRPSGDSFDAAVTVAPIPDEFGDVVGAVMMIRDVTEERRTEQRVRELQKAESLATLAGGVAHDFNNILATVLGWADVAMDGFEDSALVREALERIRSSARRATELARQMLAYTGRGRVDLEPVDLSGLVTDMLPLLDATVSKKVRLELSLAEDLPTVRADPVQMRQVLLNLVTNASEAIGVAGGRIEVRTTTRYADSRLLDRHFHTSDVPAGRYVVLEIADTGPGMDHETMMRVFDPFFTTKFAGRGLGLAATLGIVRAHGGAVLVDSEPGRGATFRVLLPIDPGAADAAPPTEAARDGAAGTVLVVDDDSEVRRLSALMLRRAGYAVVEARDGREAVEVFAERRAEIDVVLLDLMMPELSGQEALVELRRIHADVPVVFFSGHDDSAVAEEVDAARAPTSFLRKPFTRDELLSYIRAAQQRRA